LLPVCYIYLFFASLGFRSLGDWAILSFLPIYAIEYIGLKPEISAWIITINFTGEFLGNLISSRLTDKNSLLILALSTTIATAFLIIMITLIKMFGRVSFVQGFSSTIAPILYGWIAEQTSLISAYRFISFPLIISFILFGIIYILESRIEKVSSTRKV